MEVVLLASAEADLWSAWVYYEERLAGMGDGFDRAVQAGLAQVAQFPESAPVFAGDFRRLLIRRFEHGLFFRVHGNRLVVTAVLNLRQDPQTIRGRLGLP